MYHSMGLHTGIPSGQLSEPKHALKRTGVRLAKLPPGLPTSFESKNPHGGENLFLQVVLTHPLRHTYMHLHTCMCAHSQTQMHTHTLRHICTNIKINAA